MSGSVTYPIEAVMMAVDASDANNAFDGMSGTSMGERKYTNGQIATNASRIILKAGGQDRLDSLSLPNQ